MLNKKKNNKGFTLVELLVVIAIIGILAVVAVPALFKNIEKGKIADLEADISAIRSAALSVYADTSAYPNDINDVKAELEGLSNPFGGDSTYSLESATLAVEGKVKVGDLLLNINTTKAISQNGIKKLRQDLGNKVVTPAEDQAANAGEKSIVINLISK